MRGGGGKVRRVGGWGEGYSHIMELFPIGKCFTLLQHNRGNRRDTKRGERAGEDDARRREDGAAGTGGTRVGASHLAPGARTGKRGAASGGKEARVEGCSGFEEEQDPVLNNNNTLAACENVEHQLPLPGRFPDVSPFDGEKTSASHRAPKDLEDSSPHSLDDASPHGPHDDSPHSLDDASSPHSLDDASPHSPHSFDLDDASPQNDSPHNYSPQSHSNPLVPERRVTSLPTRNPPVLTSGLQSGFVTPSGAKCPTSSGIVDRKTVDKFVEKLFSELPVGTVGRGSELFDEGTYGLREGAGGRSGGTGGDGTPISASARVFQTPRLARTPPTWRSSPVLASGGGLTKNGGSSVVPQRMVSGGSSFGGKDASLAPELELALGAEVGATQKLHSRYSETQQQSDLSGTNHSAFEMLSVADPDEGLLDEDSVHYPPVGRDEDLHSLDSLDGENTIQSLDDQIIAELGDLESLLEDDMDEDVATTASCDTPSSRLSDVESYVERIIVEEGMDFLMGPARSLERGGGSEQEEAGASEQEERNAGASGRRAGEPPPAPLTDAGASGARGGGAPRRIKLVRHGALK